MPDVNQQRLLPERPCRSGLSFEFASIFSTEPKQLPPDAPKVLFMVPRNGMVYDLALMGVIARRLIMEGRQPYFVLCDNLPMCSQRDNQTGFARDKCDHCIRGNVDFLSFNAFSYTSIWDYLEADDVIEAREIANAVTIENLAELRYHSLDIGRLQEMALSRYFFRGMPEKTEESCQIAKQFVYSGVLLTKSFERIIDYLKPESILLCDGKTSWTALALGMARLRSIKVVSYEDFSPRGCGYGRSWGFSNEGAVIDFQLKRAWEKWKDIPLTDQENEALNLYLKSRKKGSRYFPDPEENLIAIENELGLVLKQPVVTLYSSVTWDFGILQKHPVFTGMFEWINETIRAAAGKPYTLLVRVHPAEKGSDGFVSRQQVAEEIHRVFPKLPDNVKLVPPESKISSYTLMDISEASLVYTSTVGLESVIAGKPTIMCSLPNYGRRGFTIDIKSREEYFSYLEDLKTIPPVSPEQVDLARRYAYLRFFRCPIPLPFYGVKSLWNVSHYCLNDIDEILPGRNPYLDLVVDGIINDGDFIIPRELNCYEALRPERINNTLPIVQKTKTLLQKEASCRQTLAKNPDNKSVSNELQLVEAEFFPVTHADVEDIKSFLTRAQSAVKCGKIDLAIQCFEQMLEREPNHADALEGLAKVLLDYGQADNAEILLRRVLRTNPTKNSSWQWLINVYKNKKNIGAAVQITEEWLSHRPNHIPALLQAAALVLEYGSMSSLRQILEKICYLGGHPAAQRLLASLGLPIPQRQLEQSPSQVNAGEGLPSTKTSNKHSFAGEHNIPDISVLLCSYNRADTLKRCLEALEKQTLSRNRFEVVCVNDGSTDHTSEIMKAALKRLPGSYHEHVKNQGLAAARNTAIRAARGRLVVFINDDTFPEPDFLEQHIQAHKAHPNEQTAIFGHIGFAREHAERILSQVLHQHNLLFPLVGTREEVPYDFNYFVTANLSVARQAFVSENIWFDETFRRYGCEDIEVGYRLWKRGYRVYYCPRAKVIHDHRLTVHDYQRRTVDNSSNLVQFVDKYPELVPCYLGVPQLTEPILAQWRQVIKQEAPVIKKMVDRIAAAEDATPEALAGPNVTPSDAMKLVKQIAVLLGHISRHIKRQTILQILDDSPDVRYRLVNSTGSQPQSKTIIERSPLVSVIIPCYKYGCYLPEAVSSVLNQTYQNFEIIIVNDGSPDDTKEVAEKLIAEHPQHQIRLINQANSGQPAIARNNGIAEAKGEYILPLDADDKLAPQAIESCIRAVRDYPNQPVVVFGWLQYFGVEENLWKTHPFSPDRLLRRTLLPYCSMFHRSVWEFQNGYSTNVPGYEDWDFWVGAAKMGAKFINVPLVTAFYRETDASSLVDSARKKHEWLVAGIISNHSDIYEDEEVIWAIDYLERFPEAPEERQIHGQNDKFPKADAVLVVSYEELYTPEEVVWARQFLSRDPFKIVKGIKPGPVKVDASCKPKGTTDLDYFVKARQEFNKRNFETAVKYMQKYRLMMDYSGFPRILNKSGRSDDIKVSVIIVTYNRTQDLTGCLESLAKQDCADFETVVVDNGENDFEVFKQYVDQYVKCPINFVLSEGRNIGACCAKGRIIAFLDDDALVPPNYISSIKTAFETYDIFGLRGKALLKSDPDANKEPRGYNLGNSAFPTFCDMEGNSAFLREVYISLDGMDPLLFGHEGIDLTYRIIEEYGVVNKIIYWPDTIIYHDEATGDCREEKANRQALMDKYLNFKHKANIVALRNTIEKSACSKRITGKRITPVGQIA